MIFAVLLSGLVQGAAIVAITYLAVSAVSERNAATRSALWFVALLALAVIPVLSVAVNVGELLAALRPSAGQHGVVISLLRVGSLAHQAAGLAKQATPWILTLWILGAAFQGVRLVLSFARIQRIRRRAEPLDVCDDRVVISTDVSIPIAAGLLKPIVIIPRTMAEALTPSDLARVIAHERAHIRRNDVLANFIQRAIEATLFFNPWVYVIGRNLSIEREAACDDLAVRATGAADEYAACLASLAQGVSDRLAPLLTPSAFGSRKPVVVRIDRLVRNGASSATSLNYYALGGTIMLLAVLTLALQAVSPALPLSANTSSSLLASGSNRVVASTCTTVNSDALVVTAVAPEIPHSADRFKGFVTILVTIAPNGSVSKAAVDHSSGNIQVDAAVLKAAKASTYSPARKNCAHVASTYLFRADFQPQRG